MNVDPAGAMRLAACLGMVVLAACSGHSTHHATGMLTGHLYLVGGPAPGKPRALTGTVMANGPGGVLTTPTDAAGAFVFRLPAGRYSVTGRSPLYDDGNTVCEPATTVTIHADTEQRANVYCQAA